MQSEIEPTVTDAQDIPPAGVVSGSAPLTSHPTSNSNIVAVQNYSDSQSQHHPDAGSNRNNNRSSSASTASSHSNIPVATVASTTPATPPASTPTAASPATTSTVASPSTSPSSSTLKPWQRITSLIPEYRTRVLRDCKWLIVATCVYALALAVTLTIDFKYTLLGAVNVPAGIFLLNLISKSGDISFALAISELFDNILHGWAQEDVVPMRTALALSTSTGVHGLAAMAFSKARGLKHSRHWALLHLAAILISPGPGLLLMANVNPQLYYFPSHYSVPNTTLIPPINTSAGIAAFQPDAAPMYQAVARQYVPTQVQGLLQDPNFAMSIDPISPGCDAAGKACFSTLLSGGLANIKPWPNMRDDAPVSFMMIDDMPSYHIEVWPALREQLPSEESMQDCSVFGGADPRFKMCMASGSDGSLSAAWRSCLYNDTRADTLSQNTPDWTVCEPQPTEGNFFRGAVWQGLRLKAWNRTASQVFSQRTGEIVRISSLGDPVSVILNASALLDALDLLLWPGSTNRTIFDTSQSQRFGITQWLTSIVEVGIPDLTTRIGQTRASMQALSNAIAMPLFLFHSLYMGVDTVIAGNVEDPQPGLGSSFYVPATYAYDSTRPTPGFWTIMAYAGVGGFILLALLIGEWYAIVKYPEAQKTTFPLLELGTSLKVVGASGPSSTAAEARDAAEQPVGTSMNGRVSTYGVLNRAEDLRVIARQARTQTP